MRVANRQKAQFVIVVGENELKTKKAKLKNMQTGEETTISLDVIELPSH
jgi:histidyl-tRNA synthetase